MVSLRVIQFAFVMCFAHSAAMAFDFNCHGHGVDGEHEVTGTGVPTLITNATFYCRDKNQRRLVFEVSSVGIGIRNHVRVINARLRCNDRFHPRQMSALIGVDASFSCYQGVGCGVYISTKGVCSLFIKESKSFGGAAFVTELKILEFR